MAERESAQEWSRSTRLRWWGLALLLAFEALLLRRHLDGSLLHTLDAPWTRMLLDVRALVPWGFALAIALAFLGRERFARASEAHGTTLTAKWPWRALLHAFAFLGFQEANRFLFDAPPIEAHSAAVGLIAWAVSGATLVGTLLLLALPWRVWSHLFRHGARKNGA